MDRHFVRRVAWSALAAGLVGASALIAPTAATAAPDFSPDGPQPAGTVGAVPAEMLAALQRDLNLTATEARIRLDKEHIASSVEKTLRRELGADFAGAWLTPDDQDLVVAVTDAAMADEVRAAGAQPRVVTHNQRQLDAAKARLDRAGTPADGIAGWYVDVTSNSVVVLAEPSDLDAAADFVAASGASADAVRVVSSTEDPELFYDVRGGDAYYINNQFRCSIGFSVNGGFVTAGHCGDVGASTAGYNQVAQGTVQGSSFPGNDYGWVAVNSNWTPTGVVNRYSGSTTVPVAGSQEAAIGASICRSGSTTGWHCGTIQAKNATVNYQEGTVTGLTRTNVCAEGGDSGGSWLSGDQAQGVTSGGSGNCSIGGTTFFQPVNEILSRYSLSLVTSDGGGGGGGGGGGEGCSGYESTYTGSLSGAGDYDIHPGGSYYYSGSAGTHSSCLAGPSGSGSDFDLYLQRWNGSGWSTVANSLSSTNNESISYNGSAGYYRVVAYSYRGSGSYTLGVSNP